MKYGGLVLFLGSILAALVVALAPSPLFWGERHTAHERPQRFLLNSGEHIGQTFIMEEDSLSGLAVWVDMTRPLPSVGNIQVEVDVAGQRIGALYDVQNIPPSGIVVFQFSKPIVSHAGTSGQYLLGLSEEHQAITLQFQIDERKYPEGSLIHPDPTRQGDLAFQLLYMRPSLGGYSRQIGYAFLLISCGYVLWGGMKKYPGTRMGTYKHDALIALGIAVGVSLVYGFLLVRAGHWMGPTDFTKDAAYLGSAADALRHFVWPLWEHAICGGLPLMGSIEGNAISVGTVFALFVDPQRALMLMNILEAGIAAAGAYVLSRFFAGSRTGSIVTALIYGLSSVYLFKIVIGYSMIGGVFAYAPWVLLFFGMAMRYASGTFATLSGILLGYIVLRGEAHVVVVIAILLFAWGIYQGVSRKHVQPLVLLMICFCAAFFGASIKILPYLEHLTTESISLHPYVAPLFQNNLLFQTLFTVQPLHENVPVLHGNYGEAWGVFGSYVGIVPIVLAVLGIWGMKRYRGELSTLCIVSFLIAEGTLFEYVFRFMPPLDALLRMPVRTMLLVVLCIALFAGRGVDVLTGHVRNSRIRMVVQWGIIIFLVCDLGYAAHSITRDTMQYSLVSPFSSPSVPTFASYEVSGDVKKNANMLLSSGYLLPQVCADQDRTVSFIKTVTPDTPFATVPSTLTPNTIILDVPAGVRDIIVRERFDTLWTSKEATVLATDDNALHVISHDTKNTKVVLEQGSPTKRAQQVILVTVLLYLTALFICEKVKICSPEEKGFS